MKRRIKKKVLVGMAIMDIMVIIMVIVIKSVAVPVETTKAVEMKQSNVAAANILMNGNDSLNQYINQEIENHPEIVYDNLTIEQLSSKLDKSLNSSISGKGNLIATYALEKGVDPYMATAIILLETGCAYNCSTLMRTCNNVGGQKGSGCGSYMAFPTLDDGIRGFIDNLYNNFVSRGFSTPETIGPRYAESGTWTMKVNNYIRQIKAR